MMHRMKERLQKSLNDLTSAAKGRELEILVPQWRRADGSTEPLSRQERELAVRWQFFSNCEDAVNSMGPKASAAANDAFAAAHLKIDDEIGPVLVIPGAQQTRVVFGDGSARALTDVEQAAVDRYLDAFEAYRKHVNQTH